MFGSLPIPTDSTGGSEIFIWEGSISKFFELNILATISNTESHTQNNDMYKEVK